MNPNTDTPQPQQTPQYQPQAEQPQPSQAPIGPKKRSGRTKLAIWLMIGPTALFVFAFLGYALVNFVTTSDIESATTECTTTQTSTAENTAPTSLFGEDTSGTDACELFAPNTPLQTVSNVLLFLAGVIAFLTWLPGMITGIVLLTTKPKETV